MRCTHKEHKDRLSHELADMLNEAKCSKSRPDAKEKIVNHSYVSSHYHCHHIEQQTTQCHR